MSVNQGRKEFLTRGMIAFGRDLLRSVRSEGAGDGGRGEIVCQGRMVLDNARCLAQRGGCFACLDICPREALWIRPGVGIHVAEEKCDGCGECRDACPLDPPALREYCAPAGTQPEVKGD